jgi:hypothetical protein
VSKLAEEVSRDRVVSVADLKEVSPCVDLADEADWVLVFICDLLLLY